MLHKVKNNFGIKFYYYIDDNVPRVVILDSNKHYFNDLLIDTTDYDADVKSIIAMLRETTLKEMVDFFGARLYYSLQELSYYEELNDLTNTELIKNEYINVFKVYNTTLFVFSV